MALTPKQRAFVTDPCSDRLGQDYPGVKPELRRTFLKIQQVLDDLYGGDTSGFTSMGAGEAWFPGGAAGDDEQGVFRHHVMADNHAVARSGTSPDMAWDFDGANDFLKAVCDLNWCLDWLEDWSIHVSFNADAYNTATRETILSIDDDSGKPFLLMLEASGAGNNAGKLVAMATDSTSNERDLAWSSTPVNATNYFVTVAYDKSAGLLKISVNGGTYQTLDVSGFTFSVSGANPYVSLGADNGATFFNGQIGISGQPVIYFPRVALSQEESDWVYNLGVGRILPNFLKNPKASTAISSVDLYNASDTQIIYNNGGTITYVDFRDLFAYGAIWNGTDTISDGTTFEEVVFDTTAEEDGVTVTLAANSLTVIHAGNYRIHTHGKGWRSDFATAPTAVEIHLNSTAIGTHGSFSYTTLGCEGGVWSYETLDALAVSDVITLEHAQNSGDTYSLTNVYLSIQRIGP